MCLNTSTCKFRTNVLDTDNNGFRVWMSHNISTFWVILQSLEASAHDLYGSVRPVQGLPSCCVNAAEAHMRGSVCQGANQVSGNTHHSRRLEESVVNIVYVYKGASSAPADHTSNKPAILMMLPSPVFT